MRGSMVLWEFNIAPLIHDGHTTLLLVEKQLAKTGTIFIQKVITNSIYETCEKRVVPQLLTHV